MVWSGTPIAANASIPLLNAAGTGAVNSAQNYRQSLIGSFIAPAPGGPMAWRGGVIPTTWDATLNGGQGAHRDLFGIPTTPTNNAHVQVYGGNCVVSRTGSTAGPYQIGFNAVTDLQFDPADPTNPRIDVAAVRLIDTAIDGAGAQQGGYMYVINGTASSSPITPTIPADYIPLFKVLRPANDSTIGTGHGTITDMRKSTGVVGGCRPLLAGDALTDPGSFHGEFTVTAAGIQRRWDATTSTWRGVSSIQYQSPVFAGVSNTSAFPYALGNVTVPDPGYPYRIEFAAMIAMACGTGGNFDFVPRDGSASGAALAGPFTIVAADGRAGGTTSVPYTYSATSDNVLTGSHSVYMVVNRTSGVGNNISISAVGNRLTCTVIPA